MSVPAKHYGGLDALFLSNNLKVLLPLLLDLLLVNGMDYYYFLANCYQNDVDIGLNIYVFVG